tara:strand:- start:506 stop:760 length:255 start_codon:yes stop_codon:yes gene_type:complete
MNKYKLPKCASACAESKNECKKKNCKFWISFAEEQNCSLISIEEKGAMTLDQVSKRLGVSLVRVSQIEKQALNKLLKRIKADVS